MNQDQPLLRQNVAVLFSEESRQFLIREARERDQLYAFTGADGQERHWLKGQYAYLAPAAAATLLNRCNVKHDLCQETEIGDDVLAAYRVLWVPNGVALAASAVDAISRWIADPGEPGRRLVVTGRTSLPAALLGLADSAPIEPAGYTGWSFSADSPFGDTDIWEDFYLSGYRGHTVARAEAAPGARVLAELWEFGGDMRNAETAIRTRLGDAIVQTSRTLFIANQVLEYLGGAIQAQFDVDEVRGWYYPTHYLDTLGYLLRELLLPFCLRELAETQLRSFGTYEGALVLRHDTDVVPGEAVDHSMLDYEIEHQIPATYVVLDPEVSPEHTTPAASQTWIDEARRSNLIEIGLHNDGYAGDPPTYVAGTAMCEHFLEGDRRLGITSATAGRHYGFHLHPETLDAMEYLYDHNPALLGLCSFSVLQVIEYGKRNPDVFWLGRAITYSTRFRTPEWTSGAVSGWWFPFHVVIATTDRYRVLRGWDSTKESDSDFARTDELLAGQNAKNCQQLSRLPNPVITVQYHPQHAQDPALNGGQGSLPWVSYLSARAERLGFWLANKRMVYRRLNEYEQLRFRIEPGGELAIANPTDRTISGFMVQTPGPVATVLGDDGVGQIHIVDGRTFTLPPIPAQSAVRLRPLQQDLGFPRITQPNHKRLEIVSAVYRPDRDEAAVTLRAVARSSLVLRGLRPGGWYENVFDGVLENEWRQQATKDGTMTVVVNAPAVNLVQVSLTVRATA
jgi:hypothetical protein